MKNKVLSLVLSAVVAFSTAACGSSAETGDSGVRGGKENSVQEDSNTLTVWAWDRGFNIYAMEEAAKIYQKDHPEFTLNIVEMTETDTQLATIFSSGNLEQLPDIMLAQDYSYQKYLKTYENIFADLTDSGIDFSQFSEGKLAVSVADGKNYGIPFDNGAEIAAYRVDLLDEAGYTIDDLTDIDWNRFIEIGKDVLDKTGYSLFSSQAGSSDLIVQMIRSAGGVIWNEDGTPYYVGNDIMKVAIEVYKELYNSGVMAMGNSWDEYIGTFTSGKTLGVINGCWIMASIETMDETSGNWAITNMPSLPGVEGATNYSNQGGSTWGITSNCKNLDLAKDFMKSTFAGSKELYDIILPGAGALSTWLPAGESDVYSQPQEFYGGEPVFEKIMDFASKVPVFDTGIYFTEAGNAISTAATNYCTGADLETELATAEETVKFSMGQ